MPCACRALNLKRSPQLGFKHLFPSWQHYFERLWRWDLAGRSRSGGTSLWRFLPRPGSQNSGLPRCERMRPRSCCHDPSYPFWPLHLQTFPLFSCFHQVSHDSEGTNTVLLIIWSMLWSTKSYCGLHMNTFAFIRRVQKHSSWKRQALKCQHIICSHLHHSCLHSFLLPCGDCKILSLSVPWSLVSISSGGNRKKDQGRDGICFIIIWAKEMTLSLVPRVMWQNHSHRVVAYCM